MKQNYWEFPFPSELDEIIDLPDEERFMQHCSLEIMESEGLPVALQAAVLKDSVATRLIFEGR